MCLMLKCTKYTLLYLQGLFMYTYILTRIFDIVLNTYDDELKVEIVEVESSEFGKKLQGNRL